MKSLLFFITLVPVSASLWFADLMGSLTFMILTQRRRIAIDNILQSDLGVDGPEARRIAKESFRSFTRMLIETIIGRASINSSNWHDFVTIEGSAEAVGLMTDSSNGVILAAGHLGNWEVALRACSMCKPYSVVYRPFHNPYLDRDLNGSRGGANLHFIPKADFKSLGAIRGLRRGEALGLMIDQHIGGRHQRERVAFFGRGAWAPRSLALIALASKAPVLVCCCARTGRMKFTITVAGPIEFEPTGDRVRDTQVLTQMYTKEIENLARRFPEQYMWGHRRWRKA